MTRKTSQYFNMKLFYTFKALKPPSSLVVDFVADEKRPLALQVVDLFTFLIDFNHFQI